MTLAISSFASFHSSEAVYEGSADGIIEISDDDRVRQVKNLEVYVQITAGHLVHSNDTGHITTDQTYCTEMMTTQQYHSSIDYVNVSLSSFLTDSRRCRLFCNSLRRSTMSSGSLRNTLHLSSLVTRLLNSALSRPTVTPRSNSLSIHIGTWSTNRLYATAT